MPSHMKVRKIKPPVFASDELHLRLGIPDNVLVGPERLGGLVEHNPLTAKGKKAMASMKHEYGPKKGEEVFYATMNKRHMGSKWHK